MTTMDVLLAPSFGEGFGVPQVEAQACGVPIITSNFAASAELASPDSFLVNGQPLWDAGHGTWFNIPFVHEIAQALELAYERGKREYPETIAHAKKYDANKVFDEGWKPLIEKMSNL